MPDWTADQEPDVRAPLPITAPADGSTASWARHEFNAWLAIDVPAGDLFDDLVLAVYESLANAADHAYLDTDTGPVRLLPAAPSPPSTSPSPTAEPGAPPPRRPPPTGPSAAAACH